VRLSVDEVEALRLKDLQGLEQGEAARVMRISRQTFQRILEDAHRKVAEGLVKGRALRIEGGDYELAPMQFHCRRCGHRWEQLLTSGAPLACPSCEEGLPEATLPVPTGPSADGRHRHGQTGGRRR
jgi:rubrerythrin